MNLLCLIGIQQYLNIYFFPINYQQKLISFVVYFNGVLFHSFVHTTIGKYIRIYDILTNLFLILYCNYYTLWQYNCLYITFFSTSFYFVKSILFKINNSSLKNQILHVLFVQYPLYICLKNFTY